MNQNLPTIDNIIQIISDVYKIPVISGIFVNIRYFTFYNGRFTTDLFWIFQTRYSIAMKYYNSNFIKILKQLFECECIENVEIPLKLSDYQKLEFQMMYFS